MNACFLNPKPDILVQLGRVARYLFVDDLNSHDGTNASNPLGARLALSSFLKTAQEFIYIASQRM